MGCFNHSHLQGYGAELYISKKYVDSLVSEEPANVPADSQLQLIKKSASPKKFFGFSPPRNRLPVTLFGRARFGFQESAIQHKENILCLKGKPSQDDKRVEQNLSGKGGKNCELRLCNIPLVIGVEDDAKEVQCEKWERESELEHVQLSTTVHHEPDQKYELEKKRPIEPEDQKVPRSLVGSSKFFSENFRKFYRSMNVAVPQPLPSLVELMNARKRAKRRVDFSSCN